MGKNKVSKKKQRYLIYVDWPQEAPPPRMRDIKELFDDTGVSIPEQDFQLLQPGKYVICGLADDAGKKAGSQLPGVKMKQVVPEEK